MKSLTESLAHELRETPQTNLTAHLLMCDVWQDIVRIDQSIKKRQFHKNDKIVESCKHAKDGNGRLHFLGLVSFIVAGWVGLCS